MPCVNTNSKEFKYLAQHFDVDTTTLNQIVQKYWAETGSVESFPTKTYVEAQLGKFPYLENSSLFGKLKQLWDVKYRTSPTFTSVESAISAKQEAEKFFPSKVIHVYKNNSSKYILSVQEPVSKIVPKHRKDFDSWQEYNDYVRYMGDYIPESEREVEGKKIGPQPFTFNDGMTVTVPFRPNSQQAEALNEMNAFIHSNETSMTLSGYAGTGKTSLMEAIAQKAKQEGKEIVFSASTNKAASVLRSKVTKAGFTANTLNKVFGIQVEVDSSKPYDADNLVTKLKEAEITPGTIIVIDEASMINEENYAILNTIAKENELKIIYVGDKGQLAPVKETKVSKVFRDTNSRVITLTKVERTEDNAILKEATAIRNGKPFSGESSFNSQGKGVAYIRPDKKSAINAIINKFAPMLRKNPDYFRILAYRNSKVAEYNKAVREALGYKDNKPRVGEPIVGYSNWGAEYDRRTKRTTYNFINSESYKVVAVGNQKQVKHYANGKNYYLTAVPIVLSDSMGNTLSVDLIDVKDNAANRETAIELAKVKSNLWDEVKHLPLNQRPSIYGQINAIEKFLFINDDIENPDVRRAGGTHPILQKKVFDFGYAMTVHKSQGSTFTHVIVDDTDIATASRNTASWVDDSSAISLNLEDDAEMDFSNATMTDEEDLDLGFEFSTDDKPFSTPEKPSVLNASTINNAENNAVNMRQQLEYVAVSRATDTVTVISNNVKVEGSPLNPTINQGSNTLTEDKIQKHSGNWSRQEAMNNPKILYVFTDNTDRDSGSGRIPADSWYSKKYGEGHHFPTMTAAVVRGLENSRPISTQRWYHAGAKGNTGRWTDTDVEEFKKVIREELEEIVREFNTGKYDTIMFPDGDGLFNTSISNITKSRTPQLYQALGELLHEFGLGKLVPEDIINSAEPRSNNEAQVISAKQTATMQEASASETSEDNNNQTTYSNDFRRIQETVRRGNSNSLGKRSLPENQRQHLADVLRRELESQDSFGNRSKRVLKNDKHGTSFTIHEEVDPKLFHDIFEIARYYTDNAELVDLHDDYSDCRCYLNEDGTCGFAIEPDGNLISVFNLNVTRGFLRASKDFILEKGATHLDAFASSKQNLREMYEKLLGAKVASSMDYNMDYDKDDIAKNHGNPEVVFMVMGEAAKGKVEEKHFSKDQYDEAQAYQQSFVASNSQQLTTQRQNPSALAQNNNTDAFYSEDGKTPITIYRGYAMKEDREASTLEETLGHTAVDYDDTLKGAIYFTSSKEEAEDYAKQRTDKSPEPPTQENPQGRPINRHYTGDYAKVSQYHIAANAKVEHYKDITDYRRNGKQSDADVIVLGKGTLWADNTEYIVKNPSVIIQQTAQSSLPGPETKINIYAGINENTDLSNFAERPFNARDAFFLKDLLNPEWNSVLEGIGKFKTVEGAFQAMKIFHSSEYKTHKINGPILTKEGFDLMSKLANADGAEAKKIGKSIRGLDVEGWNNNKKTYMKALIKRSFASNEQALQKLLATGNAILTHTQDKSEWGTEFPRILMEVRDELRAKTQPTPVNTITEPQEQTQEVDVKVSLPEYEDYKGIGEPVTVDAEWKKPVLQDLDSQLSDDNSPQKNQQIITQMDRAIESPSQEEYEKAPTIEKQKLNERMSDYEKVNQQLNNLLDNSVGLKPSEIRETARTIMNTVSDIITELQQNPEKIKEYWPSINTNKDLSNLSRKQIVTEVVGINNLIELAKQKFDDLKWSEDPRIYALYDYADLLDQHDLVMDNWDAIMFFASDIFSANEGFGIERNRMNHTYEAVQKEFEGYDYDEYSEVQDEEALLEEHDEQEHWQVEARTLDAINSMSEKVRMAFNECYVLDENGNKVLDKWGMPERIPVQESVKKCLYWTKGTLNINEMTARLEAKKANNPWVSALLEKLQDNSGNNSDFQSQFYGVMHRHFQLYGVGQLEDGKYKCKIVNRNKTLESMMSNIRVQFQLKQHPLFTSDARIDREGFENLKKWTEELYSIIERNKLYKINDTVLRKEYNNTQELSAEDKELAAKCLSAASTMLGYPISQEELLPIIDDRTLYNMQAALTFMVFGKGKKGTDGLKAQIESGNPKNYEPFKFKGKNSIEGALRKFLAPIADIMEETALTTIFEDGKMYQSYVIPSFLSQLFDHFAQEGIAFNTWMSEFYGNSQWFVKGKEERPFPDSGVDIEYWTPWLQALKDEKARGIFEHHVQLNFNKKNYMRNMSPEEHTLSCFTNYFFRGTDAKDPNSTPAWFRVPIMSNKPSSEFIKFYSYRSYDYKERIAHEMLNFFWQELMRIDTVRKRNKKPGDAEFISSWDKKGRTFTFMPWLNSFLIDNGKLVEQTHKDLFKLENGLADNKKNAELKELLNKKLDAFEGLTPDEEARLTALVEESTQVYLTQEFKKQLDIWEKSGVLQAAEKIENITDYNRSVAENLENFYWNDFFAANNILQLTIVDKAFYKSSDDLQKRLSELHAPGIKANKFATDYYGRTVSDGTYRTVILKDFDDFVSNIIDNIAEVFDRKIALAPEAEKQAWVALKEFLVGEKGKFRNINVADAQAFSSPTSYRKKALMFGKWSEKAEEIYQRLLKGDSSISITDLEAAFQPLKPFVYGHMSKNVGTANSKIQEMNVPLQAKNAEYLLIMADALMRNEKTSRPNLLAAIFDTMEESHYDIGHYGEADHYREDGIDTIQFESAIKSGGQGILDLNQFLGSVNGEAEAKAYLKSKIYKNTTKDGEAEHLVYNYDTFVHSTDFDNYALQQEVPKHFMNHEQMEPSQKRANIPADLDYYLNPNAGHDDVNNINYYIWKDSDGNVHRLTAKEFREEYERVHADNIEKGLNELVKLFHLDSTDPKAQNVALSELLQEEIASSPRYGIDLMQACQIDTQTGKFRIPKGDPVQAKRIEQLINSIIKSRVNKQKLAGGPIVQVTSWGVSQQLHIRFNAHSGGLLKLESEFAPTEKYKTYEEYKKAEQAGIAYFEVLAPVGLRKVFEKFQNPDGTINLEAVEKCDPELLKMITARIPNEDKYSIAHAKIVGFTPAIAGEVIMFPYELTEIDDSDFDVDKRYCHIKALDIKEDWDKIEKLLFKSLLNSYKNAHEGFVSKEQYHKLRDEVRMFVNNPQEMVHSDSLQDWLYSEYQRILKTDFPYKTVYPKKGTRDANNNQIFDMDWAVMSNEMTASKILNPGGFDIPKKDAYVIAAYRTQQGKMAWEALEAMTLDELKGYSASSKDLATFGAQVQYYKQNAAGSGLIGVFAVNKVAHAMLEDDGFLIDIKEICGDNFKIAGKDFSGRMRVDPVFADDGTYVSKVLGSMIGASADTAKDPWLDLIGINMDTAGIFNVLLRLGMPEKTAALFMAQDAIAKAVEEYNRTNLESSTTLDAVVEKKIDTLNNKHHYSTDSNINRQGLSLDELRKGLLSKEQFSIQGEKDVIDYKVLQAFLKLRSITKAMRKLTLVTRLNSISAAVGPLIVDNIILEHKLNEFLTSGEGTTGFYDAEGRVVDLDTVLGKHPILKAFSMAIDSRNPLCPSRVLFKDMTAGTQHFRNLLDRLPENIQKNVYKDRQLLSSLSDFYQSYVLVASGVVNSSDLKNLIETFPESFNGKNFEGSSKSVKELYPNNAFIQAIEVKTDKQTNKVYLTINTTGMSEQEKEVLRMAWAELHMSNPELSTKLFTYAFFKGGIGFSPKTWMGLLPTYVKEHIVNTDSKGKTVSYIDAYRHIPTDEMDVDTIIEQFVRNNWDNTKLIPKKGGKGTFYDYSHLTEGVLTVASSKDIEDLEGIKFIRTEVDKQTYLWERVTPMDSKDKAIVFNRISPLGNGGEYVEMSKQNNQKALSETVNKPQETKDSELNTTDPVDALEQSDATQELKPSVEKQAQDIKDLLPVVMKVKDITNPRTAEKYLTLAKEMVNNESVPHWVTEDIQAIASELGLKLNTESAVDWFKKIC